MIFIIHHHDDNLLTASKLGLKYLACCCCHGNDIPLHASDGLYGFLHANDHHENDCGHGYENGHGHVHVNET